MRVLAYELNEVPWDVIDAHVRRRPGGAFARLVRDGACFTTRVEGPLHPWITWPTLHRGTAAHGIRHLGQAPVAHTPPLWEAARANGRRVGVFGALHSWPPKPGDGFHVPDLFAEDPRCEPAALAPFQAFCLEQVRTVRTAVAEPDLAALTRHVPALVRLGLRPRTIAAGAALLADARRDPRRRYRLPLHGGRVAMDVFAQAWRRHRPDYASFFTTHVAWLLHRLWRASQPQDFAEGRGTDDPFFAEAIPYGMDLADAQLAQLLGMADADPQLVVVVASSMGQRGEAVGPNLGALSLVDEHRMLTTLGVAEACTRGRAMEPDVPLRFATGAAAGTFARRASTVTDTAGEPLFVLDRHDTEVFLRVSQHHAALVTRTVVLDGRAVPIAALGLTHDVTDTPCTGVHTPDGVLAFLGGGIRGAHRREVVAATRYAPTLLGLLGVAAPPTMPDAPLPLA